MYDSPYHGLGARAKARFVLHFFLRTQIHDSESAFCCDALAAVRSCSMPNSLESMFVNFCGKSGPLSDLRYAYALVGSILRWRFCLIMVISQNLIIPGTCGVDSIIHNQQYLQYWSTIMKAIRAPPSVTMLWMPVQSLHALCLGFVAFEVGCNSSRVWDAACDDPSRQKLHVGFSSYTFFASLRCRCVPDCKSISLITFGPGCPQSRRSSASMLLWLVDGRGMLSSKTSDCFWEGLAELRSTLVSSAAGDALCSLQLLIWSWHGSSCP